MRTNVLDFQKIRDSEIGWGKATGEQGIGIHRWRGSTRPATLLRKIKKRALYLRNKEVNDNKDELGKKKKKKATVNFLQGTGVSGGTIFRGWCEGNTSVFQNNGRWE